MNKKLKTKKDNEKEETLHNLLASMKIRDHRAVIFSGSSRLAVDFSINNNNRKNDETTRLYMMKRRLLNNECHRNTFRNIPELGSEYI
jgi:hypothetical protein